MMIDKQLDASASKVSRKCVGDVALSGCSQARFKELTKCIPDTSSEL
jgi:hypothetical protein